MREKRSSSVRRRCVLLLAWTVWAGALWTSVVPGAAAARASDLSVSAATYLGGSGDDVAGGADIALDGTLLFAGALPGFDPAPTVSLLGGGDGIVLRLAADGRSPIEGVRLGTVVSDLEVAADGRVAVAVAGVGLVLLEADLRAVSWSDPSTEPLRVAVGGVGEAMRVAVLDSNRVLRVFDGGGTLVGQRVFGDSVVADVAVSPDGQRVVVTGFNNRSFGQTPVQIPFLRAYEPMLTTRWWTAYDWTASQVANDQNGSLADSRGVRVAFGADGALYFAGRTDGGNNTFRFDPLVVDRPLSTTELVSYDAFSNTAGISGAFAITVFARFDPAGGAVDKLQLLLARLSSGNGNTVVPTAITADASGRVFVGGRAFATVRDRDALQIDGQPVGAYQGGEAFFLAVEPDFSAREVWTVFTADGGAQNSSVVGVAARGDRVVWVADLANETARMLTSAAFQPARDDGPSTYLATRLWRGLFADNFESGTLDAWAQARP